MEKLSWETNISSPWNNINHHHQQTTEETIIFRPENSTPITTATGHQTVSHRHLQTSLDCLLSAINGNSYTSPHHGDDDISIVFSDYNHLRNNLSRVSSQDSIDGIASQSSSEKRSNFYEHPSSRLKKPRSDPIRSTSSTINFRRPTESDEVDSDTIGQMKEMIYRAAAFRPVSFEDGEVVGRPRRRNVRISSEPQTAAARRRRERVSERIRVLQKLVPGGSKMDTASMLDEAANYLKFLRKEVKALEKFGYGGTSGNACSTTQSVENVKCNVALGVPFGHFLLPQQEVYPTTRFQ